MVYGVNGMTVEVLVLDALIPVGRHVFPDRDCCVMLQITVTLNLAKCSL